VASGAQSAESHSQHWIKISYFVLAAMSNSRSARKEHASLFGGANMVERVLDRIYIKSYNTMWVVLMWRHVHVNEGTDWYSIDGTWLMF
jgi:hypothetical protein